MFNEFDAFMFGPYGISIIDNFDKQLEALEKFVVEQEKKSNPFGIQCVQSNHEKGVFTVKWTDSTVTMVSCQPGDDWDDEKALAMCFMKKALGNKGSFNDVMRDTLKKMAVIPTKEKVIPAVEVAPAQTKAEADFDETMKKLKASAAEVGEKMKQGIARILNGGEESVLPSVAPSPDKTKEAVPAEYVNPKAKNDNQPITNIDKKQYAKDVAKPANAFVLSVSKFIADEPRVATKEPRYELHLVGVRGERKLLASGITKKDLAYTMREWVKISYPFLVGTPFRYWDAEDGLTIDFGTSHYFQVPGLTVAEYIKNN